MAASRGERHAEHTAAAETTASPLLKRRQGLLSSCTPERCREQQLRVTDNSTRGRHLPVALCALLQVPLLQEIDDADVPERAGRDAATQAAFALEESALVHDGL